MMCKNNKAGGLHAEPRSADNPYRRSRSDCRWGCGEKAKWRLEAATPAARGMC